MATGRREGHLRKNTALIITAIVIAIIGLTAASVILATTGESHNTPTVTKTTPPQK